MAVKWYWAHDGNKFIEFENPQERTAFYLIQPVVESTFRNSEDCHILVNIQKCNNEHYMPDLVFLKTDGCGVLDLKHYHGKVNARFERRDDREYPFCIDEKNALCSQGHDPYYRGEFKQVLNYSYTLKNLVKNELGYVDPKIKVLFGLCFTGINADLSPIQGFVSKHLNDPRLGIGRHIDLCTISDLPTKMQNAAFGRLPHGCFFSEGKIHNIIKRLCCRPRTFTEPWIEIDNKVYTQSSVLVGRHGTPTVQDIQLHDPKLKISERHLVIIKGDNDTVRIQDISLNGTRVNHELLKQKEISVPLTQDTQIHLQFPNKQEVILSRPGTPKRINTRAITGSNDQ